MSFSRLITVKAGNSQQRQAVGLRGRQKWVRGYNEGKINVKIKTCAQDHRPRYRRLASAREAHEIGTGPYGVDPVTYAQLCLYVNVRH